MSKSTGHSKLFQDLLYEESLKNRSTSAPTSPRKTFDARNTSGNVEIPLRPNASTELSTSDTSAIPKVSLVNNTLRNALKPFASILHFSLRTDEPGDDKVIDRSRYDKAHDKCRRYRRAGTKFFRRAFYYEALIQYTESLKHALIDHEDFPRTCNKRSVVLFFLGFYKECLADLDRLEGAPYDFRDEGDERELRRKKAIEKLKHGTLPIKGLSPSKMTEQSVQAGNHYHDRHQMSLTAVLKDLNELDPRMPFPSSTSTQLKINRPDSVIVLTTKGNNKKILTACKDIKWGEFLLTEKPYISGPILDETLMCWDCMDVIMNPIPCDSCSLAAYCSKICKNYSWKKYHEYECQLLSLMKDYYFEYSAAIRMLLSVRDYDLSLDDDAFVDSEWFREVFRTNAVEIENLTEGEKKEILWVAEEFYKIITTRTNFLNNVRGTNLTKKQKCFMFKGMILKTLLITKARSYQEIEIKRYVGKRCIFRSMYSSIFPSLSHLEHSCTPNSCISIQGEVARVIAIEPIRNGESITVCYSHLFTEKPKKERQLLLKDIYNKTCSCAACVYCWPLMDDLPNMNEADKIRLLQEIDRVVPSDIPSHIERLAIVREIHDKLFKVADYKWTKPSRAHGIHLKVIQRLCHLATAPISRIDNISIMHPNPLQYLDCRHLNSVRVLKQHPRQRKREQQQQQHHQEQQRQQQ